MFVLPPEQHVVQIAEDEVVLARCEESAAAEVMTSGQKGMVKKGALVLAVAAVVLPIFLRALRAITASGGAVLHALLGERECVAVKMIQVVATGPQAQLLQVVSVAR